MREQEEIQLQEMQEQQRRMREQEEIQLQEMQAQAQAEEMQRRQDREKCEEDTMKFCCAIGKSLVAAPIDVVIVGACMAAISFDMCVTCCSCCNDDWKDTIEEDEYDDYCFPIMRDIWGT
eukprot:COSAG01_NODE_923_length_12710_cov_68.328919_5_plen_120_part_00